MLLLPVTLALACDEPIFRTLAAPATPASGKAFVTGDATLDGQAVVGARFVMRSAESYDVWKKVLGDPEHQDDWVPDKFGYDLVERIDASHLYLQVNVGFLFGAVRVRRQIVAKVESSEVGSTFTTCWEQVDPSPYTAQIARFNGDAEWQATSAGWWSVTPAPEGGVIVSHQWWSAPAGVPAAVLKFGASRTLPDLLDAFEAHARALSSAG